MIYLSLPIPRPPRRLPFFLAMEEWVAESMPDGEYFFIWQQSGPTVICGRNQTIPLEVDLDLCRREGIDVVRRRSGGGAVIADENNLMLSYVCPRDSRPVEHIFSMWSGMLAQALNILGISAEASGRNDICCGGRKISGGSFYALPHHAIVHSTMLYRLPSAPLTAALTPDRAKLESKGIKSVVSRITSLIDEGLTLSKEEFASAMQHTLCNRTLELSQEDVHAIEQKELRYYEPAFLRIDGQKKITRKIRTTSTGEVCASFHKSPDGRIRGLSFSGDFFAPGDIATLEKAIEGLTLHELGEAAMNLQPGKYISGMDATMLRKLFFTEP